MFGFRRSSSGQELTLDQIFAHLAEIKTKIDALNRSHDDRSTQANADLLNDVLRLLDIDFQAFTGDEVFWDRIREKIRAGKAVFHPSLSSPSNQLLTSVEGIIKKESGSTAEAGQLIRLIHSLGTIGTAVRLSPPPSTRSDLISPSSPTRPLAPMRGSVRVTTPRSCDRSTRRRSSRPRSGWWSYSVSARPSMGSWLMRSAARRFTST